MISYLLLFFLFLFLGFELLKPRPRIKPCHILKLPNEILYLILDNLSVDDLKSVFETCYRLNSLRYLFVDKIMINFTRTYFFHGYDESLYRESKRKFEFFDKYTNYDISTDLPIEENKEDIIFLLNKIPPGSNIFFTNPEILHSLLDEADFNSFNLFSKTILCYYPCGQAGSFHTYYTQFIIMSYFADYQPGDIIYPDSFWGDNLYSEKKKNYQLFMDFNQYDYIGEWKEITSENPIEMFTECLRHSSEVPDHFYEIL